MDAPKTGGMIDVFGLSNVNDVVDAELESLQKVTQVGVLFRNVLSEAFLGLFERIECEFALSLRIEGTRDLLYENAQSAFDQMHR